MYFVKHNSLIYKTVVFDEVYILFRFNSNKLFVSLLDIYITYLEPCKSIPRTPIVFLLDPFSYFPI